MLLLRTLGQVFGDERGKRLFTRTSIKEIRNLYCTNLNKDNDYAQ